MRTIRTPLPVAMTHAAIRPRGFRQPHQQRIGDEGVADRHLVRRHLTQQQRQIVQVQIMPGVDREAPSRALRAASANGCTSRARTAALRHGSPTCAQACA